jgi:N-acetylglucosaminyl-diphospho-decaprenol L-rhamnosyltransferase
VFVQSRIGVVIATCDRRVSLLETLARVTGLPERPRIVVVDNGSTDGTPQAVASAFPQVEILGLRRNRGAAARNAGVEHVGTPYAAFLDDDSWWEPGALTRAVDVLDRHPRVAVLAARVLVGDEERLDPVCRAMERSPLPVATAGPGPAVLGFVACGAVVRRDAFLQAGGFDERYGIGGEEQPLAVRLASAGWELRYVREVVAHHHPARSGTRSVRDAQILRNDLWTAWSLRRGAGALLASARLLRSAGLRRATLTGLAGALRRAPGVVRRRRPATPAVEAGLRLLERHSDRAL